MLVNNAALFVFHSVETATADDWDRSAAVNIKGHALLTKACLPYMKAAGGGSIVFQGSISSFLAQPNCATYSTMKGAIVQLARNCAYDFAKYGIRCNSVCAGTVETPISREERAAHGWTFEQWQALKTKDVMLGRVGHVREVANATLFFACAESSYCTATHLTLSPLAGSVQMRVISVRFPSSFLSARSSFHVLSRVAEGAPSSVKEMGNAAAPPPNRAATHWSRACISPGVACAKAERDDSNITIAVNSRWTGMISRG